MSYFDVFHGDADGLCALHQLRLAEPRDATHITGCKREFALVQHAKARSGDSVTVLDLSTVHNRDAVCELLARGVSVEYIDHHLGPELAAHPALRATIDTAADVCTSLLIDRRIGGAYRAWALVGAFGDGLDTVARALASAPMLPGADIEQLQLLGACLNYNAYGEDEQDPLYAPIALYELLHRYADPFEFITREPVLERLSRERREDLQRALHIRPVVDSSAALVSVLPPEAWARRVIGTLAHDLAVHDPTRIHVVIATLSDGQFTINLRTPADCRWSADALCRPFGGGGRATAAGIVCLPASRLSSLVEFFARLA